MGSMLGWILIAVGYVAVLVLFRFLGGFGSAGRAIEQWGRTTAEKRRSRLSLPTSPSRS
jgi:hypothetical protein